ncbi:MAG: FixH family protein [Bacteroidota bacterium]
MKFHFGTGIAIFYTIFATTLLYFVFKSTQYDHSLVREDYYKGDLEYQQHYDKLYNTKLLSGEVVIQHQIEQRQLLVHFPEELKQVQGNATFFRPSSSQQDIEIELATDGDLKQIIPTNRLQSGLWKVKLDWVSDGKPYYKEIALVI